MKILAIDTSSKNATVAITEDEIQLIELNNEEEKTHSQKLMPMLDEIFRKTKLSLSDIELIVGGLGPGSFTGVRIGIATVKAFADSKKIPVVGVSSLEAIAYNLNMEGNICVLMDAGHSNTYAGLFEIRKDEDGNLQTVREELTFLSLIDENKRISEKNLIKFLDNHVKERENIIYLVGDATIAYREVIEKIKNRYKINVVNHNTISGITIARIGYTKYKNGESGNSSILSPLYLRKSQAELALEQK